MENLAQKTINERILELVDDMGGPSEVARLMGVSPQLFYNLKNRPTSKPNSESLEKFFEVAPRANANYIYKGIGPRWLDRNASEVAPTPTLPEPTPAPIGQDADPVLLKAKDDLIKIQQGIIEKLERKGEDQERQIKEYAAYMLELAKRNFPQSDGQNTDLFNATIQDYTREVMGFVINEQPKVAETLNAILTKDEWLKTFPGKGVRFYSPVKTELLKRKRLN